MEHDDEKEDLLYHVLRDILMMESDDILLLNRKRIRSFANLKHLTFSRLLDYKNDGTLYDGDYEELRLFLMYLAVNLPTHADIEALSHDDWENIDHVALQEQFYGLQLQPRAPKPAQPPPVSTPEPPRAIPEPEPDPIPEPGSVESDASSDYSSEPLSEHLGTTVTFPTPTTHPTTVVSKPPEDEDEKEDEKVLEKGLEIKEEQGKSKPEEKPVESESDEESLESFIEGGDEEGRIKNRESLLDAFSSDEESADLEAGKEGFFKTIFGKNEGTKRKKPKEIIPDDDDSSIGSDDTFLDIRTFRAMQALKRNEEDIYQEEVNFFPNDSEDEGDDDSDRTVKKTRMYDDILAHKVDPREGKFSLDEIRLSKNIEEFAMLTYKTPAMKEIDGLRGKVQGTEEFYLDFILNRRWKAIHDRNKGIEPENENDYNRDLMAGKKGKKKNGIPEVIAEDNSEVELEELEKYEDEFKFPFGNDKFKANVTYTYSAGFEANQKEKEKERLEAKRQATTIGKIRKKAGDIVNNYWVQVTIVIMIGINCAMMGIGTYSFISDNDKLQRQWDNIDMAFLIVFTIELLFQFTYEGLNLFRDGWLLFDLFVILLSWVSDFISGGNLQVLRAFRIFRAFRLITRVKVMKDLVSALIDTLPSMVAIVFLLIIIMFIFSVMFTSLVGDIPPEQLAEYDDDVLEAACYFSSIFSSLFTLFQFITLDGFADVVRSMKKIQSWYAYLFIFYILISGFVVINLVIAVICDAVGKIDDDEEPEQKRIVEEDGIIEELEWKHIDLDKHLDDVKDAVDRLEYNQEFTLEKIDAVVGKLQTIRDRSKADKVKQAFDAMNNDTSRGPFADVNRSVLPDLLANDEEKKENDVKGPDTTEMKALVAGLVTAEVVEETVDIVLSSEEEDSDDESGEESGEESEDEDEGDDNVEDEANDSDDEDEDESESDDEDESESESEDDDEDEDEDDDESVSDLASEDESSSDNESSVDSLETELEFLGKKNGKNKT